MAISQRLPLFFNRRFGFMLVFGFSSGLPLALTGSTLQAWLTETHVNLIMIGILSLVSIPYNFKFLWAPLLDRFIFAGLGRRRGWILLTQCGLFISLILLSFVHPVTQMRYIYWGALFIAFISATQDIAVDAYRIDILLPTERGLGTAYYIFAYRMAMFASGGLALVLASYWGWERTYQLMGFLMLPGMIAAYYAPEMPLASVSTVLKKAGFFLEPFLELWHRDNILLLCAFVILYKAGAALAVALLTYFLLHGVGFSLIEIGMVSKVVMIVGTILGTFVGGAFLLRLGLYTSLLWFGLAQAVSILCFMLLAIVGKVFPLMVLSLFIENFCSGMSMAALMAFIMSQCNPRYGASQFAFFSSIDIIGRLLAGPLAAVLVLHFGWIVFYGWSFVLSLPAMVLLFMLRKRVDVDDVKAFSY